LLLEPPIRLLLYQRLSTAGRVGSAETVRVTHPYHPLYEREFRLVTFRHDWGEDRVFYLDDTGKTVCIPASWTNARGSDPYLQIPAEPVLFRVPDLLQLVLMLKQIDASKEIKL
jgi:hypothetical protein